MERNKFDYNAMLRKYQKNDTYQTQIFERVH